ncbi:uncharacterized protein A4U43_C08F29450 [Asparagus officinalis]|uniref:lysM domain-containing GPI-anchored protein 1-like n=1 Tax=Asparagus officinalis TaxID=4686 RepID=UPI00098DE4A0|nr:lysM domain-containing GPI-anchored protein 1-like [Asparagus officinalis]ONK61394.1 uncharacterized protein A4U43_C08F29450 [Asparagus officinalis]
MEGIEPSLLFLLLLLLTTLSLAPLSHSKSTIEPCSGSDACTSLVGYTLYTDLKISECRLFQVGPLLPRSAVQLHHPAPRRRNASSTRLFLASPPPAPASDGLRRSLSHPLPHRPSDTLSLIASSIFSGLTSPEQIRDANSMADADPDASLEVGQSLVIPLPCTCFNNTDSFLPAVYLSYVVQPADTVPGIAARYDTTVSDIMNVNGLGSPVVKAGDIVAIPLPACTSKFPSYASDSGLVVANGSYAITADHCVQCSCGPGDLNLYCMPASLSASCSSMQCRNSNLMLGNITSQSTSAGCNVTSCSYGGFVNGTIVTTLSTTLQPRCPAVHQFPAVIPPPTEVTPEPFLAPAPAPVAAESGGLMPSPKASAPGGFVMPGVSSANGPAGSISGSNAAALSSDIDPLFRFGFVFILFLLLEWLL